MHQADSGDLVGMYQSREQAMGDLVEFVQDHPSSRREPSGRLLRVRRRIAGRGRTFAAAALLALSLGLDAHRDRHHRWWATDLGLPGCGPVLRGRCQRMWPPPLAVAREREKPKSPATRHAGLSEMRRRGLEPPPGNPGPGPQPGEAGVISVHCVPHRPDRAVARTIWTHRMIWKLSRMLPRLASSASDWHPAQPREHVAVTSSVSLPARQASRKLGARCLVARSEVQRCRSTRSVLAHLTT